MATFSKALQQSHLQLDSKSQCPNACAFSFHAVEVVHGEETPVKSSLQFLMFFF